MKYEATYAFFTAEHRLSIHSTRINHTYQLMVDSAWPLTTTSEQNLRGRLLKAPQQMLGLRTNTTIGLPPARKSRRDSCPSPTYTDTTLDLQNVFCRPLASRTCAWLLRQSKCSEGTWLLEGAQRYTREPHVDYMKDDIPHMNLWDMTIVTSRKRRDEPPCKSLFPSALWAPAQRTLHMKVTFDFPYLERI